MMSPTPMDTYAVSTWKAMKMGAGRNWREEINKEFYFLYARGFMLSKVAVSNHGAQAIFSSKRREIEIRWDRSNRLYVQIYRSRSFWKRLFMRKKGINVFELARKRDPKKEISVFVSGNDFPRILGQNAEFMREHLMEVIDGSAWVEE